MAKQNSTAEPSPLTAVSNVIPFPLGLRKVEIKERVNEARRMVGLHHSTERRAYITGWLDCMLQNITEQPEPAKPARRAK